MTLFPKNYTEVNMRLMFEEAYNYYDQKKGGKGNIYISKKTVNDLHIAVLPNRNTYVFSEYNLGDDEDVEKLQQYQSMGIHKTYLCSLCPILEEDNAVILSDEQNQLYLNKNDSPAVNLRYILIGNSGNKYNITGTVPQYYYGHLLWSTVNHVPTYGLFLAKNIFSDLLLFLRHCTQTEPKTKAFFNGTFGSDIYHCHVHLSYQDTPVLEAAYSDFNNYSPNTEVYTYIANIVKLIVITSTDIERLFKHVSDICTEYIKIRDTNPSILLTANLAYTRGRYWVTFQKINKDYARWEYNNCGFYTLPASFVMISDCMKVPQNQTEYDKFKQAQLAHYEHYYQRWDSLAYSQQFSDKFVYYLDTIRNTPLNHDSINKNPVEFLWLKFNLERITIDQQTAIDILTYLGSTCISEGAHCDDHTMGKYKYLIGLGVNNLPIDILNAGFSEIRINAIFYFLRGYVTNGVKSDYLFFRGTFAQKLLVKTFENFLKITGTSNGVNLPLTENDGVNTWLKYNFKRIGEPSKAAAGATLSELVPYKYNDKLKVNVEFFIKIMLGTNQLNFLREFFASMSVNDIRNLVPNYMLCYGGFMCNGDEDNEKLCNYTAGNPFSYLLLENIKNSETVDRVLKLPSLATEEEAQDLIDMIYQIVAGLCVGWETNQFTHYDLHLDNIMRYDFVSNKDYLNLFKIYQEEKGDAIPKIEKILFKYYTDPNNPNKVFHVPVKYLYVIIDYGVTYTNGMPQASLSPIGWLENNGFDSTKPNSYYDIYTMISYFLLRVMVSKPYLVFDKNGNWLQHNILVDFFESFLTNFEQLFITDITQVMQSFSNLQKSNPPNRRSSFNHLYLLLVKPAHQFVGFPHFLKNFDLSSVGDSFSSSWKLLNFMYERYYANINFKEIEKQDEVYVFNWGYTPKNIIRGIEPNSQIKDMIDQKDQLKKQKIEELRNFVKTINI